MKIGPNKVKERTKDFIAGNARIAVNENKHNLS